MTITLSRNAKYLEALIQGKKTNDPILGYLDSVTIFSFILGVILASIIGISIATNNVLSKEITMTDKETTNKTVDFKESFNGASNISPKSTNVINKSFNGAQNIAPSTQDSVASSSADDAAASQPAAQSQTTDTSSGDKK